MLKFKKAQEKVFINQAKKIKLSKEVTQNKLHYVIRGPKSFHLSLNENNLKDLFLKFDDSATNITPFKILKYRSLEDGAWFFDHPDLYTNYHSQRNSLQLQDLIIDQGFNSQDPTQSKLIRTQTESFPKVKPENAFESQENFNLFFESSLENYIERNSKKKVSLDGPEGLVHFLLNQLFEENNKTNREQIAKFLGLYLDSIRVLIKGSKKIGEQTHKKTLGRVLKTVNNLYNEKESILRLYYIARANKSRDFLKIIEKYKNKILLKEPKALMVDVGEIFRDLLKDLLDYSGLTIKQFSNFIGIQETGIALLLDGKNNSFDLSLNKETSKLFVLSYKLITRNQNEEFLSRIQEELEILFLGLAQKRTPEALWKSAQGGELTFLDMIQIIERQKNTNRKNQYKNLPEATKKEITQESFLGNLSRLLNKKGSFKSPNWQNAFIAWSGIKEQSTKDEILNFISQEEDTLSKEENPEATTITEEERTRFNNFFKNYLLKFYIKTHFKDINPSNFISNLIEKEENEFKLNKKSLLRYLNIGRIALSQFITDSDTRPATKALHKIPLSKIIESCNLSTPYTFFLARIIRGDKNLTIQKIIEKYEILEIKTDQEKKNVFCQIFKDLIDYSGFSRSYVSRNLNNLNQNYLSDIIKGTYHEIGIEEREMLVDFFIPLVPYSENKKLEENNEIDTENKEIQNEREKLKEILDHTKIPIGIKQERTGRNKSAQPIFTKYMPERQEDFNQFFKKQLYQYIKMASFKEAHLFGKYGFINYLSKTFYGQNHILVSYLGLDSRQTLSRLRNTEPAELGDSKITSSRITHDLAKHCLAENWTSNWLLYHISRGNKDVDLTKNIYELKERISSISEIGMIDREAIFLELFDKMIEFSGIPTTIAAKELGYSTRGGLSLILSGKELPNMSKTDDIVDLLYPDFGNIFSSPKKQKEIKENRKDLKLLLLGLNRKRTIEELLNEASDPNLSLSIWRIPEIIRRQKAKTIPEFYKEFQKNMKTNLKQATFENYLFQFEKKHHRPENSEWTKALIYLLGFRNKNVKDKFTRWLNGYEYEINKISYNQLKSIDNLQQEYQLSERTSLKTLLKINNLKSLQASLIKSLSINVSLNLAKIKHKNKTIGFFLYHITESKNDKIINQTITIDLFDIVYSPTKNPFYFILSNFISEILSPEPSEYEKIISVSLSPEMLSFSNNFPESNREEILQHINTTLKQTADIKQKKQIRISQKKEQKPREKSKRKLKQKPKKSESDYDPDFKDPIISVINASEGMQKGKQRDSKEQQIFNSSLSRSLKKYLQNTERSKISIDGENGFIKYLFQNNKITSDYGEFCNFLNITRFGLSGLLLNRQETIEKTTHNHILEKITKQCQPSKEDILMLYYIARGNKEIAIPKVVKIYLKKIKENLDDTQNNKKTIFKDLMEILMNFHGLDYIQLADFLKEESSEIYEFWGENRDFFGLSTPSNIDHMTDFFMNLHQSLNKNINEESLIQLKKNFKIIFTDISNAKDQSFSKKSSSNLNNLSSKGGIDFTGTDTPTQENLNHSATNLKTLETEDFNNDIKGLVPIRINFSANVDIFSFYGEPKPL